MKYGTPVPGWTLVSTPAHADEAGLVEHGARQLHRVGPIGSETQIDAAPKPLGLLADLAAAERDGIRAVGRAHDDRLLDVAVPAGDVLAHHHRDARPRAAGCARPPRRRRVVDQEHALVAEEHPERVRDHRLEDARVGRVVGRGARAPRPCSPARIHGTATPAAVAISYARSLPRRSRWPEPGPSNVLRPAGISSRCSASHSVERSAPVTITPSPSLGQIVEDERANASSAPGGRDAHVAHARGCGPCSASSGVTTASRVNLPPHEGSHEGQAPVEGFLAR